MQKDVGMKASSSSLRMKSVAAATRLRALPLGALRSSSAKRQRWLGNDITGGAARQAAGLGAK